MSVRTGLLALSLLILSSTAMAMAPREPSDLKTDPKAKSKFEKGPVIALAIARYPDGGYITDINFDRKPPVLRPGMYVVINGKGFGERHDRSLVSLYNGPARTGIWLDIKSWSDIQIAFEVPSTQTRYFPTTNKARLNIQIVKNGAMTWYELHSLRFVAQS